MTNVNSHVSVISPCSLLSFLLMFWIAKWQKHTYVLSIERGSTKVEEIHRGNGEKYFTGGSFDSNWIFFARAWMKITLSGSIKRNRIHNSELREAKFFHAPQDRIKKTFISKNMAVDFFLSFAHSFSSAYSPFSLSCHSSNAKNR